MHAFSGLLDHFGRHVATEVDFDHNVVGVEVIMATHHGLAPLRRASNRGPVSEHGKSAVVEQRRSDDANLVAAAGRIDADSDPLDQLEGEMMALSREWDGAADGSPNRLDAMVWGLTRLSKVITQIPIA